MQLALFDAWCRGIGIGGGGGGEQGQRLDIIAIDVDGGVGRIAQLSCLCDWPDRSPGDGHREEEHQHG